MRKIQDGMFIGNSGHARNRSLISKSAVAAIIDLAIEEPPVVLFRDTLSLRFPLHDGHGNSDAIIRLAIQSAQSLLAAGIPCLVACSAGLSRSPVIAAAAVSLNRNQTISSVLLKIADKHPLDVSPRLLKHVTEIVDTIKASGQTS